SSFASAWSKASMSSRPIVAVQAFSRSGRLSVIVRIPSDSSVRICSKDIGARCGLVGGGWLGARRRLLRSGCLLRSALGPRHRLLELRGEADQRGLLPRAGDQLDADGDALLGPVQGQARGG